MSFTRNPKEIITFLVPRKTKDSRENFFNFHLKSLCTHKMLWNTWGHFVKKVYRIEFLAKYADAFSFVLLPKVCSVLFLFFCC